jgi:hypothetical protein
MLSHTRSTSLQHRLQWRIADTERECAVSTFRDFRDFCDFRDFRISRISRISRAFRNNDLVDG